MTDLRRVARESDTIALISVLYNSEPYLGPFFRCLGEQSDRDFCLILVDNASPDGSLETARRLAAASPFPCEFIVNRENRGIAAGNNQGIEKATEMGIRHVVLINNDVLLPVTLIRDIRERAIAPGHLAWTCLAYEGNSARHWYGGGYMNEWLARGIHFGQRRSSRIRQPMRVTFAPACLLYLHGAVFDRVGMMDERYFVYYEDTDFCRRMNEAGIPLIYDPQVSFRHFPGGSNGGSMSPFFLYISTRNKFLFIRKHYRGFRRTLVMGIAILSKLVQLAGKRRGPTWRGLREGLARAVGRPTEGAPGF